MKKRTLLLLAGAATAGFLVIRSRTKPATNGTEGTGQTPVTEPSAVAAGVTEIVTEAAPAQAGPILDTPAQTAPAQADPVVPVVEEVLHRHEGEDTPMVHAFEEAVAHEHGDAPA